MFWKSLPNCPDKIANVTTRTIYLESPLRHPAAVGASEFEEPLKLTVRVLLNKGFVGKSSSKAQIAAFLLAK
jgi:hypothetical protein